MAVAERCVRLRVFGAEATGFEPTLSTPEYCWGSVRNDSGDCQYRCESVHVRQGKTIYFLPLRGVSAPTENTMLLPDVLPTRKPIEPSEF